MVEMYTAAFLFHRSSVLLVRKMKPTWQKGLWNAIGGKIEADEGGQSANRREFREETGRDIFESEWTFFAEERANEYTVHFFKHRLTDDDEWEPPAHNDVDEELAWYDVDDYDYTRMIGNLQWLIPAALDWRGLFLSVTAKGSIKEKPSW